MADQSPTALGATTDPSQYPQPAATTQGGDMITVAQAQIDAANQALATLDPQIADLTNQVEGIGESDTTAAYTLNQKLTALINQRKGLLDSIQTWTGVRNDEVKARREAEGKPLTAKEAALLDSQKEEARTRSVANEQEAKLREAQTEQQRLETAAARATDPKQKAALETQAAQAKIATDAAQTAYYQAQTASQGVTDQINKDKNAREAILQPYDIAAKKASTAVDVANAQETTALLPGKVDTQTANIAGLLEQAGLNHQQALQIAAELAAGVPASTAAANNANAAQSQASAAKTAIEAHQTAIGTYNTIREQMGEAIKNGMSLDDANAEMYKAKFGASPYDLWKERQSQAVTLGRDLMANGSYVRPGQTSLDPSGSIAGMLGQLGIKSPDLSLSPQTMPNFVNSVMGPMPGPGQDPTFTPDNAGAWAGGGAAGGASFPGGGAAAYMAWRQAQMAQGQPQAQGVAGAPDVLAAGPMTDPGASQPQVDMGQGPPGAPAPVGAPQPTINVTVNSGPATPVPPTKPNPVVGPQPPHVYPVPQQGRPPGAMPPGPQDPGGIVPGQGPRPPVPPNPIYPAPPPNPVPVGPMPPPNPLLQLLGRGRPGAWAA